MCIKKSGITSFFDERIYLLMISPEINIEPKFCYNGVLYSWTDALTFRN